MRALLLLGALCALLAVPRTASAQEPVPAPLEAFVQRVAELWGEGDVGGLIEMVAETGRFSIDLGAGPETVTSRHAAAALRSLFAERESQSLRAVRVAFSGGQPPRGYGELAWTYRSRGAPAAQSRPVFVGTVWDGSRWRISELRLMP